MGAVIALVLLVGPASADDAGDTDPYPGAVYQAIWPHWESRSSGLPVGLQSTVRLSIDADGTLLSPRLQRSSGNATFDEACLAAVVETGRVPPPPPSLRARFRRGVLLVFEVDPKARGARARGRSSAPATEQLASVLLPPSVGRAQAEKQALARVSALRLDGRPFVLAKVCAGTAGKVTGVTIVKSGGPALDQTARADLAGWTFRPYKLAGEPVPFCFMLRLTAGG